MARVAKKADPAPASVSAAKARKLCEELIGIHKTNARTFERIDGIKASLKQLAKEAGSSFREVFADVGQVTVQPEKEPKHKGDVAVVVPEVFSDLPKKERDALVKKGIVKIEPQYSGKYYGAVEVKLFAEGSQ